MKDLMGKKRGEDVVFLEENHFQKKSSLFQENTKNEIIFSHKNLKKNERRK